MAVECEHDWDNYYTVYCTECNIEITDYISQLKAELLKANKKIKRFEDQDANTDDNGMRLDGN